MILCVPQNVHVRQTMDGLSCLEYDSSGPIVPKRQFRRAILGGAEYHITITIWYRGDITLYFVGFLRVFGTDNHHPTA